MLPPGVGILHVWLRSETTSILWDDRPEHWTILVLCTVLEHMPSQFESECRYGLLVLVFLVFLGEGKRVDLSTCFSFVPVVSGLRGIEDPRACGTMCLG